MNARLAVAAWTAALAVCILVQSAGQASCAAATVWGRAPGWQGEIAVWNAGMTLVLAGVLAFEAAAAAVPGLIILSLGLGFNHLHAAHAAPAFWGHWLGATGNFALVAFAVGLLTVASRTSASARIGTPAERSAARAACSAWVFVLTTYALAQSMGQNALAGATSWGHAPGWQTEVAIWCVGAACVLVGLLMYDSAALAAVPGLAVLALGLGGNHLAAAVAEPSAALHWALALAWLAVGGATAVLVLGKRLWRALTA